MIRSFDDTTRRNIAERCAGFARLPDGEPAPLFGGLEPYPGNWRAAVSPAVILPHYPMVLHRGGYPDGS